MPDSSTPSSTVPGEAPGDAARESKILLALNAASSAMIQVDLNGRIELVNNRAGELFGYTPDEMIGQQIEILVPERLRSRHASLRHGYYEDRDTRRMAVGRDLFGLRKDGTEVPLEITLTPVDETPDSATMVTIVDITDRKAKERHISFKNQQLKRLNRELLQFAYSASHDLKAPLASITGILHFCEIDLENGDLEEVRDNLHKSKQLVSKLVDRIEKMLITAKSEMMDDAWEEADLAQRLDMIWAGMTTHDVMFSKELNHAHTLRTNTFRLDIILESLLVNAVQYRKTDGTPPAVTVSTWDGDDALFIRVADNGIGIPLEKQKSIFSLFHRVYTDKSPDSGVGLALANKNVLHLGGEISVESNEGGTAFTVMLPHQPVEME